MVNNLKGPSPDDFHGVDARRRRDREQGTSYGAGDPLTGEPPDRFDNPELSKDDDYTGGTGSSFDWMDLPAHLEIDGRVMTGASERGLVRDTLKMIDTDGYARATHFGLIHPITQANYTIEKPEDDKGQTEFLREVFETPAYEGGMETDLSAIIERAAMACAVKRTYFEKEFTRSRMGGGRGSKQRITYKAIHWRPPASCDVQYDRMSDKLLGFRQYVDLSQFTEEDKRQFSEEERRDGYKTIWTPYASVFIHGRDRDPMFGASDLAPTFWAYQMKQKVLMLWLLFLDGQSLPKVITYGKDKGQAQERARKIASLKSSGVLGLSMDGLAADSKVFELLESSGQGATQFKEMVRYLESQMAISTYQGFLELPMNSGSGGTGSYALSADLSSMYMNSRVGVMKSLAKWITGDMFAPLVRLNFGTDAKVPRLVVERVDEQHSNIILTMLQTMATAQNIQVPMGFIELLIERVAQYLDLPDDKVQAMLEDYHAQEEEKRKQAEMIASGEMAPPGAAPGTRENPTDEQANPHTASAVAKSSFPVPKPPGAEGNVPGGMGARGNAKGAQGNAAAGPGRRAAGAGSSAPRTGASAGRSGPGRRTRQLTREGAADYVERAFQLCAERSAARAERLDLYRRHDERTRR